MKKIAFIFILGLAAFGFNSCGDDKDPAELSFQDIYGRPGWEIEASDPQYFEIKKSSELEFTETADGYAIETTGANPNFTTQRLLNASAGQVLSFQYKASEAIQPSVSLDVTNSGAGSVMWDMKQTTEWTEFSFDLGLLISAAGWGATGSYVQIGLGDQIGVDIEIKDIEVRGRNAAENNLIESYLFDFPTGTGSSLACTATKEINTYGAYEFEFALSTDADPNMATVARTMAVTADMNQCQMEYKSTHSCALQIFFKIDGACATSGMPVMPAASEWTPITIDLTATMADIFSRRPDAGDIGAQMRLDIDGMPGGNTLWVRGMRLSKK